MVTLKRAWSDGTAALVFTPLELVERLAAMVPPPRANQVLYRGVLAANAAWRPEVVPKPPDPARRRPPKLARPGKLAVVSERPGWAELLERVFRVWGRGTEGPRCARGAQTWGQ